jgi:hypothetical protein
MSGGSSGVNGSRGIAFGRLLWGTAIALINAETAGYGLASMHAHTRVGNENETTSGGQCVPRSFPKNPGSLRESKPER